MSLVSFLVPPRDYCSDPKDLGRNRLLSVGFNVFGHLIEKSISIELHPKTVYVGFLKDDYVFTKGYTGHLRTSRGVSTKPSVVSF